MTFPDPICCQVITLSDRASQGVYDDRSGPAIREALFAYFKDKDPRISVKIEVIPDDPDLLKKILLQSVDEHCSVIFTTGGTGLGARDFTPDVVKSLLDKELPGIMELIRVKYGMKKPHALLSRGIAGLAGQTLIYCLPGSVRAVTEYCHEILPTLVHSIRMVHGIDDHR